MKITKSEKVWLILTIIFFILYNIPGIPVFRDAKGLIIHSVLTVVPLWLISYIGMVKINKVYKLRSNKDVKDEETKC